MIYNKQNLGSLFESPYFFTILLHLLNIHKWNILFNDDFFKDQDAKVHKGGKDGQNKGGTHHQTQVEYLPAVDNQVAEPFPADQIFTHDVILNENPADIIQALMVVPMLAPIITEMACASVSSDAFTNDTVITVVAADDWTATVTKAPVATPDTRLVVILPRR